MKTCRKRTGFSLTRVAPALVIASIVVAAPGYSTVGQSHVDRQRARKGIICGNPKASCKTSIPFEPNDLPFRVPERSVIVDTELFYAIILTSLRTKEEDCDVFVPEAERLATQALFPDHKVFTSRCADPGMPGSGMLFYTNVNPNSRIMAVYGGTTLAEAKRMLAAVKAAGKFPGANVRRMRTGFNGT